MAISGPIAPYSNVPINAQFYQPSRFVISNITLGQTTIVTTTDNMNYVVGQLVRLLIPKAYGSFQLNGTQGYVISLPAPNQVEVDINSSMANSYISTPFVANISGATKSSKCVLTVDHPVFGSFVLIKNVGGMTQLNGNIFPIDAQRPTSITLNVDSTGFSTYTSGGTATVFPINGFVSQILAIGDTNSGQINSSGRISNIVYIPGSFINISPL